MVNQYSENVLTYIQNLREINEISEKLLDPATPEEVAEGAVRIQELHQHIVQFYMGLQGQDLTDVLNIDNQRLMGSSLCLGSVDDSYIPD